MAQFFHLGGGGGGGGGRGGMAQNDFSVLTFFFEIHFKISKISIFLGFKVSSERSFHKFFKTGLTF